jgi:MSHA biogenesis protein MshK
MTRAALLAAFVAFGVQAAPFADPFSPPKQMERAPAEGAANAPAASRLESVLIAPDRRIAVIDGRQYLEGERFADGRVLRISESEVVIRHPGRDEKLALFPQAGRRQYGSQGRTR